MEFKDNFKTSLDSIRSNKMRSFLTMLGVIIGVASVISMMSIGNSSKQAVLNRIQSMGTNKLNLRAGVMGMRGGAAKAIQLKRSDAEKIKQKCKFVDKITCEVSNSATVKYLNSTSTINVTGVDPDYAEINSWTVLEGRYLDERDVKASAKVAVIGNSTVNNLFGSTNPIGKSITINGNKFKVIGTLKEKGGEGMFDPDDCVFVPISTAMKKLFGTDDVRGITIQAKSQDVMDLIVQDVTKLMRKTHKLKDGEDDDFTIRNQADMLEMINETSQTFTTLLMCIASISLIVGGIGIMNIMLVSVTERTREIGIRKALGAKRSDIRNQFLVESVVLSIQGGLIGVIIGVLFSIFAVSKFYQGGPGLALDSILISFGFSMLVGVFFGWYPANQAAKLDPIIALRYE
ncbi:MAG: ABC transporter permease [Abditibacteriota bacterium]|nr:ABC transporter permease [Abditibacteriota bacterium]